MKIKNYFDEKPVYFAILVAIAISSCSKDVKTKCPECKINKPLNKELIVKIGKSDFTTAIQYWNYKSICLTYQTIEEKTFFDLSSALHEFSAFSKLPFAIVLYTDNLLSETNSVSDSNIIGLSYFYIENSNMYHCLYKRMQSRFLNDKNLNCEVEGIISNDLHNITLSYFDKTTAPNRSWVLFFSTSNSSNKLINPKHELTSHLQKLLYLKSTMEPSDD